MRYSLIIITMLALLGCGDDTCEIPYIAPPITDEPVYQDNINEIEQYLANNNLQANVTDSGLYYIIDSEGSEEKPTLCDAVNVAYTGYFTNGIIFDSSPGFSFFLSNVIAGWREGIPLYGKGGSGVLLVPSYLAYGATSPDPRIPANAVLLFDIELIDF